MFPLKDKNSNLLGYPEIIHLINEIGCFAQMPSFKDGERQFTPEENEKNLNTAKLRVHVERYITF